HGRSPGGIGTWSKAALDPYSSPRPDYWARLPLAGTDLLRGPGVDGGGRGLHTPGGGGPRAGADREGGGGPPPAGGAGARGGGGRSGAVGRGGEVSRRPSHDHDPAEAMYDTSREPETSEAFQTLLAQVGRKSPKVPAEVLVRQVLRCVPAEEWPVRVAAMEALLRRLGAGRRGGLRGGAAAGGGGRAGAAPPPAPG